MAFTISCKNCTTETSVCCDGSAGSFVFQGLVIENEVGAKWYFHYPWEFSINGDFFTFRDLKGNTKTIDRNNTTFPTNLALKTFLNDCKCGGGCTRELIEITDDDLTTAGSPTTADVKDFVDANMYTDVVVYYVGSGSDPAPAGSKVSPDYTWEVDCTGNVVRTEYPQGGGAGGGGCDYRYKVTGTDCVIKASGLGVTYSLTGGVATITIPENVRLCSFYIWGVSADLAGDNSLTIRIDDSANGGMNTSEDLMLPFTIQKWNEASRAASGLDTAPFTLNLQDSPQVQIDAVSGSVLDHKVINLNAFPYWGLKGVE